MPYKEGDGVGQLQLDYQVKHSHPRKPVFTLRLLKMQVTVKASSQPHEGLWAVVCGKQGHAPNNNLCSDKASGSGYGIVTGACIMAVVWGKQGHAP